MAKKLFDDLDLKIAPIGFQYFIERKEPKFKRLNNWYFSVKRFQTSKYYGGIFYRPISKMLKINE